jgi:hypothetical protein
MIILFILPPFFWMQDNIDGDHGKPQFCRVLGLAQKKNGTNLTGPIYDTKLWNKL